VSLGNAMVAGFGAAAEGVVGQRELSAGSPSEGEVGAAPGPSETVVRSVGRSAGELDAGVGPSAGDDLEDIEGGGGDVGAGADPVPVSAFGCPVEEPGPGLDADDAEVK
jgi:hypothetical protein